MSSYSRQQLEAWLKALEPAGSVIDIGGSQNPVLKRINSKMTTDYQIMDLLSPHENAMSPDIIWDINEELESVGEFFDNAFMLEVSEYLYDPLTAHKNIARLLKQGGWYFGSYHFIYPVHNPEGLDYLRYTDMGIRKLLTLAGFDIIEIIPRTEAPDTLPVIEWAISNKMKPSKTYKQHDAIGWLVIAKKL